MCGWGSGPVIVALSAIVFPLTIATGPRPAVPLQVLLEPVFHRKSQLIRLQRRSRLQCSHMKLLLNPGNDTPVAEGRLYLDISKSGGVQNHEKVLPGILLARHPKQHRNIERGHGRGTSFISIEQHFMKNDASARRQALKALACNKCASICLAP